MLLGWAVGETRIIGAKEDEQIVNFDASGRRDEMVENDQCVTCVVATQASVQSHVSCGLGSKVWGRAY
jgi:hypothetical protein